MILTQRVQSVKMNIIHLQNKEVNRMELKTLRKKHKLTRKELGELVEVGTSTIAMIENGTNYPSVKLAKRLGELFGVDWKIFYE